MIDYRRLSGPCSSEDRALASGARCKGSSPFRGALQLGLLSQVATTACRIEWETEVEQLLFTIWRF